MISIKDLLSKLPKPIAVIAVLGILLFLGGFCVVAYRDCRLTELVGIKFSNSKRCEEADRRQAFYHCISSIVDFEKTADGVEAMQTLVYNFTPLKDMSVFDEWMDSHVSKLQYIPASSHDDVSENTGTGLKFSFPIHAVKGVATSVITSVRRKYGRNFVDSSSSCFETTSGNQDVYCYPVEGDSIQRIEFLFRSNSIGFKTGRNGSRAKLCSNTGLGKDVELEHAETAPGKVGLLKAVTDTISSGQRLCVKLVW
jgi:hypothetical protein